MRFIVFLASVLVLGCLQVSLAYRVSLFGITPDLFSGLTAAAAVSLGPVQSAVVGVAAGFFKDSFDILPFGANMLLLPLLALAMSRLNRKLSLENGVLCGIVAGAGVFLCAIAGGILLVYYGTNVPAGILLRNGLSAAVLTGLVTPLLLTAARSVR